MDSGFVRFIRSGIQLATARADNFGVNLLPPLTAPTANVNFRFFNSLPAATQALTIDQNGQLGTTPLSGGGSVTSIGISAPTDLLSVTSSPVTASGTIALAKVSQAANLIYGTPNGAAGVPGFRALVAADIPNIATTQVTNFDTQVRTSRLDQMAAPTANLSMNAQKISSIADATLATDVPSWQQVQNLFNGQDNKASVRLASTADVSIATAPASIDGTAPNPGDRILLKNQTTQAQNGIYIWNGVGSAMTRASDADTTFEVTPGLNVFVEQGTQAATLWYLNSAAPLTLGTSNITFTQIGAGAAYTAGNGLSLTSNTFTALGTANRIAVGGSGIDISSNYVGQTSITTLGTIATGTWNGTTIALANGGTGATTAAAARTNLAAGGVNKGTFTSANLVSNILTITHTLGVAADDVIIKDPNGKLINPDDISVPSGSTTLVNVDLTSFNAPVAITGTYTYAVRA